MILVNLFKVQSADVVSLRDTNTCGAVDPGLRRDDDRKNCHPVARAPHYTVPLSLSPRGLTTGPRS